jgi:pantoate--beta-alanine ligase
MQTIDRVAALRERLARESSVAFVPTMGNLHAGHIALVAEARRRGQSVVASVFVNRLQFDPGGDFDRYPRTLERDARMLAEAGCDVLFCPAEAELYPAPQEIVVTAPAVSRQLCGDFRPGHFDGVVTVVAKLFNIVAPNVAVFGRKDYQQLQVIRALVKQLNYPVEIVGIDTVREPDGLAMSSRNGYLSPAERAEAVRLNRALHGVVESVRSGARDFDARCAAAAEELTRAGWRVDYVAARDADGLGAPGPATREVVVLGAAWLGKTRLIDNLSVPLVAAASGTGAVALA